MLSFVFIFVCIVNGHFQFYVPPPLPLPDWGEIPCGANDIQFLNAMQASDPIAFGSGIISMDQFDQFLARWPLNYSEKPWDDILEIPVNIHMLYNPNYPYEAPNLSYEQIMSQIIVLINDYNKHNSDWVQTPEEFIERVTNYEITFKLSKIIRKEVDIREWSNRQFPEPFKFDESGGSSIIDGDVNLNIWVLNIYGLAGRAQFPWTDSPKTDGIIMRSLAFGSRDYDYAGNFVFFAPEYVYDYGRTATHEIGHWIALRHIWGDGGCDVDDHVSDTPLQGHFYRDCPSYPQISCGSSDLFNNYMDYVNHLCRIMYTDGQANRSHAAFELFENRESFIEYQDYDDYDEFVNAIYFVVNDTEDIDQLNVSCAYGDIPYFGLIDLNQEYRDLGYDIKYQMIPCVQTTENKYVDPVIDIQVVTDGKCDDTDYNATAGEEEYFINTLINYGRPSIDFEQINICYIKGDQDTDYDDRIVRIGFFKSPVAITDDLIEIDEDDCIDGEAITPGSVCGTIENGNCFAINCPCIVLECPYGGSTSHGCCGKCYKQDSQYGGGCTAYKPVTSCKQANGDSWSDSDSGSVSEDDSDESSDSDSIDGCDNGNDSDSDSGDGCDKKKKDDDDDDGCDEWNIITVNLNTEIGDTRLGYVYIGFQYGNQCKHDNDAVDVDNVCQIKSKSEYLHTISS